MRPNYIILRNYRSYGDKEEKLYLDGNTARILMGKNGAGKTSFIDAMMWCIFGKSASNVDKIINRKTKKNAKVEFSFNIGSDEYCVSRYRNDEKYGDELFLYKNKDNITQSKKKDTQNFIQEIIGVSYNTIINSIIFSKETFKPFLAETPVKRLAVLDSILNLKPITIWNDELRKQRDEIDKAIAETKTKIDKCKFGIENISSSKEKYLSDLKDKKNKLEKELANNKLLIENNKKEIEEYVNIDIEKEKENNKKYKELVEENNKIESKIAEEEKLFKDVDEELKKYNNDRIKLSELERIDVDKEIKEIEEYERDEKFNKDVDKELELLISKKVEINEKELDVLNKQIKELKNNKEKLELNVCHTCGQHLDGEKTETLLLENKKQIEEKEELFKTKEEEIKFKKEKNLKLEEEISEERKKKIILKTKPSSNKEELLRNKELKNKISNDIKVAESIIENSNKNNALINERIKKLKSEKKVITIKVNYDDEFLSLLGIKIKNINDDITIKEVVNIRIEKDLENIDSDHSFIEDADKKINLLNEEIEKEEKNIRRNEIKFNYFNLLYYLTSNKNDGLKKFIVNKMIPVFNESINNYLPYFFEDNKISVLFDKDLNEEILIDGVPVSFDEFSSGEKMRLELSISISLFMLVKTFFSSSIGFVVFDEILDMNIDDEGIKSVLNIVEGLADNNSVVVISHKDQYKKYFQNKIYIDKDDNGFSRISQE